MKERLRSVLSASVWNIAGMVTMNMAAQFVVYPAWNRTLGSERYGDILFLIPLGSGCNYARMRASTAGPTRNTPYLVLLGGASLLPLPLGLLIARFAGVALTPAGWGFYILLICATMWRFYADVEYRLTLNYKGSFCYYILISIGYLGGILLFGATGLWPLALLPGELLGLAWVLWRGRVLRPDAAPARSELVPALRLLALLAGSEFLSNLIFNGDRILLRLLAGGTAVTVYYLASLLGKTISLVTTPLNSVLMGYLSRYKGRLTVRLMHGITAACLLAVPLLALCCTAASVILIAVLYPAEYAQVRGYFFIGNAAQVAYFLTNMVTVLLLRFSKARYQAVVNVLYAVGFCAVCAPAAALWGVDGFCAGLLAVNLLRLGTALGLGYRTAGMLQNGEQQHEDQ